MSGQATLKSISTAPAASRPAPINAQPAGGVLRNAVGALCILILFTGWFVAMDNPYASGAGFGYMLGITGGLLMLSLLLYPLRKRARLMQTWGPLKYWFRLHMIGGVAGPLLVLFHSTFRVGSLNAGVALSSMLLVVGSGLVGRFLYRQIHNGLYGSQASLQELRDALQQHLAALAAHLDAMPTVREEIERFTSLVATHPPGWLKRTAHFLTLGWKRRRAHERVRRVISKLVMCGAFQSSAMRAQLTELLKTIDSTLRAAQRTAQFSTYERLFSLWHVVHIPFLGMLVITAIIHVVAVHVY